MSRGRLPRSLLLCTLLAAGCGVRPEQSILDRFFAASRLRDRTALQGLARVVYEPLEQGIVRHYEITKVDSDGSAKRVTVAADVLRPDGQVAPKTLVILMEKSAEGGGWTITGVAESGR